jgi:hypothetical protein
MSLILLPFVGDAFGSIQPQGRRPRLLRTGDAEEPRFGYNNPVPPVPPQPSYPGTGDRIGRFRVLAQLGSGAMGVVYDALEENLDRRVALKVIAPQFAGDPVFRERFGREARSLASLDSPHVVGVYAHGEEDGYLYIATQLIPDGDLGAMLARWGPAPIGKAVELVEQVAAGLADAHAAGLVHRDIKPANVLVRRRGEGADVSVAAYLGDFGIARRVDAEATVVGADGAAGVAGTPSYMAPELHHGEPASARSDLYSLGCVLWVTLTGSAPYAGATEYAVVTAHLQAPVPQLAGSGPLVEAVNAVLRRSLAKDPAERYQRAADLRDDLRRAASLRHDPAFATLARRAARPTGAPAGAVVPPPPPVPTAPVPIPATAPTPPATSRRGRWLGLAAAAVLLAVGGGVAAALLVGDDDEPAGTAGAQPTPTADPGTGTGTATEPDFAELPAGEILEVARARMQSLESVRVVGDVLDGADRLGVDLTLTADGDCDGTITIGDGTATLRRIGDDTWFRADEAFWVAATDPGQGPLIATTVGDRWVSLPAGQGDEFATACDLEVLLGGGPGDVEGAEVVGTRTLDGQEVVEVATGDRRATGGTAFVALEDPHPLLRLDAGDDGEEGSLSFSAFDEDFSAEPPPAGDVFDLSGFG